MFVLSNDCFTKKSLHSKKCKLFFLFGTGYNKQNTVVNEQYYADRRDIMTFDTCSPNHLYTVISIHDTPANRRHCYHLGLLEGTKVRCLFTAPSGDPIAFNINGCIIAFRKTQLATVHGTEVEQ